MYIIYLCINVFSYNFMTDLFITNMHLNLCLETKYMYNFKDDINIIDAVFAHTYDYNYLRIYAHITGDTYLHICTDINEKTEGKQST